MMGVYIKGMKMQKKCCWCMFSKFETKWYCSITLNCINDYIDSSPNDCPITNVPEPHGRLIDEDNVIDAIHERLHILQTHKEFIKKRGDIDLLGVLPYISKIQTVIEAEDE